MTPAWVEVMREVGDCAVIVRHRHRDAADLRHWGTRMKFLAVLARRVGLDPEGGVLWERGGTGRYWLLISAVDWSRFKDVASNPRMRQFDGIDTDDPLLALALALKATTPPAVGAENEEGTDAER